MIVSELIRILEHANKYGTVYVELEDKSDNVFAGIQLIRGGVIFSISGEYVCDNVGDVKCIIDCPHGIPHTILSDCNGYCKYTNKVPTCVRVDTK